MNDSFKGEHNNGVFPIIISAVAIEAQWVRIMLSPRWSHYASWTEWHKVGVLLAILAGVLASVTYVVWARMFEKTDETTRREPSYERSRNLAGSCLVLFMIAQIFVW